MNNHSGDERFSQWPQHDDEEVQAATDVLLSGKVNYWTGDQGRLFETEFSRYTGAAHAIAVANGTVALEIALRAVGVQPGDEVIVPCRTFIASASAAVACGAKPVVVDIDPDSQNLTAETVSPAITDRTRAIVAVHLAGRPCEMGPILELASRHGLRVIEDCAQAHGARLHGSPVGSLGDAAAFSFCQDKIMSTGGEGGMIVTNDDRVWRNAWSLKDHGKDYDAVHKPARAPGFRWLHTSFGTNARMTEVQAAIGRKQLQKLDGWVEQRRHNAERIEAACRATGKLRVPTTPAQFYHSYYRCYAFAENVDSRDRLLESLREQRIPTFTGSCGEIHRESAFDGLRPSDPLPNAARLSETSLAWLVDQTLSDTQIDATCRAISRAATELDRLAA